MIQPSDQCINLIDAIKLILDFNETIQLDLVWKHKTRWMLIVWNVKKTENIDSKMFRTVCWSNKSSF